MTKLTRGAILLSLSVSALAITLALNSLSVANGSRATPLSYGVTIGSESQWLKYSRGRVRQYGLLGDMSEEYALMTFGSYLTLTNGVDNGQIALDTPIFVYEAFGQVPVLNGFGMAAGRTDIGGFTFVYDASTNLPIEDTVYPLANLRASSYGLDMSLIPAENIKRTTFAVPTIAILAAPRN